MRGLVLTDGRKTESLPTTSWVPESMVPIFGQRVIDSVLRLIVQHGFEDVVVTSEPAISSLQYHLGDGSQFGASISHYPEIGLTRTKARPIIGSAGVIRHIQKLKCQLNETLLVVRGEGVLDLNLTHFLQKHQEQKSIASVLLANASKSRRSRYGKVLVDPSNRVVDCWQTGAQRREGQTASNVGVYLFEPEVLEYIPEDRPFDLEADLLPALLSADLPVYGFSLPMRWLEVRNAANYLQLAQLVLKQELSHLAIAGREVMPGVWVDADARIDLSQIAWQPPLYIGRGAIVQPCASLIGPAAVGAGVFVGGDVQVVRSVIFDHTRLRGRITLKDALVCEGQYALQDGTVVKLQGADLDLMIGDVRHVTPKVSHAQRELFYTLLAEGIS